MKPRRRAPHRRPLLTGLLLAAGLTGCAAPPPPPRSALLQIEPGGYPAAFDRTKDVLREHGFTLDRVDAAQGVITTYTEAGAGLLTPWKPHTRSLNDAAVATIQPERRRVEVVFEPLGDVPPPPPGAAADLRLHPGPVRGEVEVLVYRLHRPWRRLDATSIRFTTTAFDPMAVRRGASGVIEHEVGDDDRLAAAIAQGILPD